MELIASVETIRSKVRVVLENGETFFLTRKDAWEGGFQEGQSVDPAELRQFVLLHQYPAALNQAVAMLARRPCSTGEIRKKLLHSRYGEETVDMVLYKLEREGLTDDAEFAAQWTRYRAGQKMGTRRIAQELKMKGISEEDAENALSELTDEDLLSQAVALARKGFAKAKAGEDPRKTRQRVISSLVRRGYDWDTARAACSAVVEEE